MANNQSDDLSLIINEELLWYFHFVNFAVVGQIVAGFGIITNVINIIIFVKMGVKDPVNISLLGLSISDFFSLLTVSWVNLCLTPSFYKMDLPFIPNQGVHYVIGAWPHIIFVKITSCITAFITLERCLCVTFALKVKEIITPTRVKIVIIGIYVFVFSITAPMFYMNRLAWVFYPSLNKSLLSLVFSEDREELEPKLFAFVGFVFPLVLFLAIIVFTIILVHNLKKNAKWRTQATSVTTVTNSQTTNSNKNQVSSRDTKVATMVVMISALFITCFSPVMLATVVMLVIPGFNVDGKYRNVFEVVFSFNFLLESINSAINILIYYFRSSNYKAKFQQIFFKKQLENNKGISSK